jgi:hypothetical protein
MLRAENNDRKTMEPTFVEKQALRVHMLAINVHQ